LRKLFKYFSWFALVCLFGLGLCIYANFVVITGADAYIYTDISTAPKSQAAMVLGAKVYGQGNLSVFASDRADAAVALYKAGKVKKILVSGDHGHDQYDEVNTIRNYILKTGISPQDVFMDHAGFDTYSSMYRARDVFKVKSLVICTQRFHLDRAVFLARSMGIEATGLVADNSTYGNIENTYNETREKGARVKAFFAAKITHPEPHFLGDSIPITGDGRVTEDGK
jgi:SanA protein